MARVNAKDSPKKYTSKETRIKRVYQKLFVQT